MSICGLYIYQISCHLVKQLLDREGYDMILCLHIYPEILIMIPSRIPDMTYCYKSSGDLKEE